MDDQHIKGMVKKLGPVLKDRAAALVILQRYWSDKMALVWNVEAMHRAANERGMALTRGQALKLLHDLHYHHNPESGIKWSDLTDLIEDRVLGRKMTRAETKRFVDKDFVTIHKRAT